MTDIRDFRSLEEYRQWLKHRRLFDGYPMRDIIAAGLSHIDAVEAGVSGSYMHGIMDAWRDALESGDGERLKSMALDLTQWGIDLRQNSPLYGVMSHDDWLHVIKDSTDEKKRLLPYPLH
ncbi:hypothetical protein [Bifidobacterium felsineum]|uniref:hypothetical protein n=1 Tax=Bifidobacterium felsineum TaxID=2045440 RepID=UPI001BDDB992|nr:hypothetical protein [Bifidobacterium felsineum]MBT1164832.1 hypothetical protein [Bifidobacterium felsineum]